MKDRALCHLACNQNLPALFPHEPFKSAQMGTRLELETLPPEKREFTSDQTSKFSELVSLDQTMHN